MAQYPVTNPVYEQVVLERVNFYCNEMVDEMSLHDMRVEVQLGYLDDVARRMALSMRGYVWGEDVGRHSVSYPNGWWEAFKERWFYSWMLRRWPVKMKTVAFDVKAVYPTLNYSLPGNNPRLILIKQRESKVASWSN